MIYYLFLQNDDNIVDIANEMKNRKIICDLKVIKILGFCIEIKTEIYNDAGIYKIVKEVCGSNEFSITKPLTKGIILV